MCCQLALRLLPLEGCSYYSVSIVMIMAVQDGDVQKTLRQERANFGRTFEIRRCINRASTLGNMHSTLGERKDTHDSLKWSRKRYYLYGDPYVWNERDEKWLPCKH